MIRPAALWCFVSVWVILGLIPALINHRYLYADGSAYLVEIASSGWFNFPWNGRQLAQIINQWLAVAAVQLGVSDLQVVGWCLGAGMMFMPVIFHTASLLVLLRAGHVLAGAVYMVMWFLLAMYTNLMSVAESHVSAAVFCLGLVVAVTGRPAGWRGWSILFVVGLLSFLMYEFWFFYAFLLAIVVAANLRLQRSVFSAHEKTAAWFVTLLLICSAVANFLRLMGSSDNPNRSSFLDMLTGTTMPVYLLLIGGWFGLLCLHLLLRNWPAVSRTGFLPGEKLRVIILTLSLLLLMLLSAVQHPTMVRYSYPFRVLNLILPLIFGVWLWLQRKHAGQSVPKALRPVTLILFVFLMIYETRSTMGWRQYMAWEADVRPDQPGHVYVAHPPDKLAQIWIYPWTQSALSFFAQSFDDGRVEALGYTPGESYQPYGPGRDLKWDELAERYSIKLAWRESSLDSKNLK